MRTSRSKVASSTVFLDRKSARDEAQKGDYFLEWTWNAATDQTGPVTYTLRRLIDPRALGWYSADEHLHQLPDSALMLAEDLNLAALPICGGVELTYRPGQKVTRLPDAHHLLVTELPALEWDCFLWNLSKPLEMRLGKDPWPQEDFATSDRPGGSAVSSRMQNWCRRNAPIGRSPNTAATAAIAGRSLRDRAGRLPLRGRLHPAQRRRQSRRMSDPQE